VGSRQRPSSASLLPPLPSTLPPFLLCAAHFGLMVVATFALLMWGKALSPPMLAGAAFALLLSLVVGAGLLESRRWAPSVEAARVVLLGALLLGVIR
jgi:hypothetical protein